MTKITIITACIFFQLHCSDQILHCNTITSRYYNAQEVIQFINKHLLPVLKAQKTSLSTSSHFNQLCDEYIQSYQSMLNDLTIQSLQKIQIILNKMKLTVNQEKNYTGDFTLDAILQKEEVIQKISEYLKSYPYSSCVQLPIFNTDAALKFARKYLPSNPTILEAGAYDGSDTVKMSKFWPNGKIYSFEPVPEIYDKCVKKVSLNKCKNVSIFCYGLGPNNGFIDFFISEDPRIRGKASQSSSFLPPKEHLKHSPILFVRNIKLPIVSVDSWAREQNITNIDFMWLDLQGATIQALSSAKEILKTTKVIVSEADFVEAYAGEFSYLEMIKWFEDQGFVVAARTYPAQQPFIDKRLMKSLWFADIIFVRKDIFNAYK